MNLSASETRVLGCMLEKQLTTPDLYPLTLNSLRLACNQSTNRDPVVDYDDRVLRDALHHLERRGFTRLASGRGRAPKYRHLLAEALPMDDDQQAIICVLMLRGPQTPGELKQRTERMHTFSSIAEVHETLARLVERGLSAPLERRPGQKEDRYAQLLEDPEMPAVSDGMGTGAPPAELSFSRPDAASLTGGLEERVARLERDVASLRAGIGMQAGARPGESFTDTSAAVSEPAMAAQTGTATERAMASLEPRAGSWP